MGRRAKVSPRTVRRILADLCKTIRRKSKVHVLKPHHMRNRKRTCRKLYEHALAGNKSEFVMTLVEAMFGLHNCKGKRKICYVKKGQSIPENWYVDKDNFYNTFMVVGAISGRGTLRLIKVPKKVKVNAEYYIQKVLKPFLEVQIPKLYPGETLKIVVHHDAASSHTAKKTTAYANDLKRKLGITIIPKQDIPIKSPDTSPLNFFWFWVSKTTPLHKTTTEDKSCLESAETGVVKN